MKLKRIIRTVHNRSNPRPVPDRLRRLEQRSFR